MRYFTSDPHFFDPDIIAYCDRPYRDVDEMNEDLVARFNAKTADASEIYILGDLLGGNLSSPYEACREVLGRLGVTRCAFHLIRGNHDNLSTAQYLRMGFRSVSRLAFIETEKRRVMLTHDPCMVQPRGTLALCGHVHTLFSENWQPAQETFTVNTCVEVRDYAPLSESEFWALASRYPIPRPDELQEK